MNFPALPRKFFSHLVLASTIGLVLSTGTLAFTKVIQNFRSPKPEVLGETTDQTEQSVNQNQPAENLPTDSPANAPKSPPNTANILNSKLSAPKTATNLNSPSFALAPLPPPTSATNPQTGNNRCIVTLSGQQYDITSLLTTHSGGNVFTCNSDMTASYQQRHGSNLSMMQPYLVTSSPGLPGSPAPPPPASNPTLPPTQPTPTNTPPPNNNRCIITLFGRQYDVTNLRTTHSGGNVFTCNSDMTASYQQRHGTNTSMMQPYLVTGSTQPPGTITPTPPREDDDDD